MSMLRVALNKVQRIRRLARLMPLADATRLALGDQKAEEISVRLLSLNRTAVIRGATSDIHCFNKVLVGEEYRFPRATAPQLIVDAGANVGYATLYFAKEYPHARIVAIEPAPDNFEILTRNCGTLPNVTLLRAALWPVRGALTLANHLGEAWAFSVNERTSVGGADVPTVTIPDILDMMKADRIGLLKLDIEGSERELFSMGSDAWLDKIDHIAIELHDRFRSGCSQAFYAALAGRDFSQEVNGENIFVSLQPGLEHVPAVPEANMAGQFVRHT